MSAPEPRVVNERLVQPGPNASIWSAKPLLGQISGQNYNGRVFIEVWSKGELVFFNAGSELLKHALSVLQNVGTNLRAVAPWSNEPAMGEIPDQTFHGRVVVEVWDRSATVATSGSDSDANLIDRAIHWLLQESK